MKRTLTITLAAAAAGVVGLYVFIGGTNEQGTPDPITVNGQTITFTYTDNNTGETLPIYTDASSYTNGLSHAEVYLAVVNNTGKEQDVELLAYFEDTKKRIEAVSVLVEEVRERSIPVTETVCEQVTSTSTGEASDVCSERQIDNRTEEYSELVWQPLGLVARSGSEKSKETGRISGSRKANSAFIAESKSQGFAMKDGEVVYYKVVIQFEPNQSGNFFFEAIGSKGGYGHLN